MTLDGRMFYFIGVVVIRQHLEVVLKDMKIQNKSFPVEFQWAFSTSCDTLLAC
jgi:hypothetical protein